MDDDELVLISCPYCGSSIHIYSEVFVDQEQEFFEDCSICCRPILISHTMDGWHRRSRIEIKREDD